MNKTLEMLPETENLRMFVIRLGVYSSNLLTLKRFPWLVETNVKWLGCGGYTGRNIANVKIQASRTMRLDIVDILERCSRIDHEHGFIFELELFRENVIQPESEVTLFH